MVYCPRCETTHRVRIPERIVTESPTFPVRYSYLHGDPRFILTLYVDKQFTVRGTEVSDWGNLDSALELGPAAGAGAIQDIGSLFSDSTRFLALLAAHSITAFKFTRGSTVIKRYVDVSHTAGRALKRFFDRWRVFSQFPESECVHTYFFQVDALWFAGKVDGAFRLDLVVAAMPNLGAFHASLEAMMAELKGEFLARECWGAST